MIMRRSELIFWVALVVAVTWILSPRRVAVVATPHASPCQVCGHPNSRVTIEPTGRTSPLVTLAAGAVAAHARDWFYSNASGGTYYYNPNRYMFSGE
jgi:hypothetical protein